MSVGTETHEQYSKQLPRHLFTLELSVTISTSLCPSLAVTVSVCACIREMSDLLSARFRHIFQTNAVIILLWRLLPILFQVSYSDRIAINTVPYTVLRPSPINPENKGWKLRQNENYSWQMILGPLMTIGFVDEMVSCFVKYSWVKAEMLPRSNFFRESRLLITCLKVTWARIYPPEYKWRQFWWKLTFCFIDKSLIL